MNDRLFMRGLFTRLPIRAITAIFFIAYSCTAPALDSNNIPKNNISSAFNRTEILYIESLGIRYEEAEVYELFYKLKSCNNPEMCVRIRYIFDHTKPNNKFPLFIEYQHGAIHRLLIVLTGKNFLIHESGNLTDESFSVQLVDSFYDTYIKITPSHFISQTLSREKSKF